jgi:SAM-dependent MidA family methyltransferase
MWEGMAVAERFDRYQERCLYDPEIGFYATGGRAGRRDADFITSPEVGPLFGTVLAGAITRWWRDAGQPDDWTVAEAGCGRGALAASIIRNIEPAVPLHYVGVERSAALRATAVELLGNGASVVGELPDRADVIVANELLDNLPVRIIERTPSGWSEVYVPDGLEPTDLVLDVDVPVGTRLPVLDAAYRWVADARCRADRVVAFDYAVATTSELADRTWLRTYAGHGRGSDPFVAPGSVDITVDVAVDQLPEPTSVSTEAEFLVHWGIDDLVDEGRRIWTERAHLGDLEAVRARSRIGEAEALCDPAGLGGFLVLEWVRP